MAKYVVDHNGVLEKVIINWLETTEHLGNYAKREYSLKRQDNGPKELTIVFMLDKRFEEMLEEGIHGNG